jgi:queuine tRNA-ribosyltransferase
MGEVGIFSKGSEDPSTRARTGWIDLPHGRVATPAFMPVGTNATVKAIGPEAVAEMGVSIILANTYHLYLRPGHEVIREAGGLHGFTGWKRNFLTDSGGFQVFSLSSLRELSEEGVSFRSHVDGSRRFIGPEEAVEAQAAFNSDIQMQLDVCTPFGVGEKEASEASDLTTRWARRAKERWSRKRDEGYAGQLFGIIQGNFYKDLRVRSAEEILELGLPGVAIGGLSVGESFEVFSEHLSHTAALLPADRPRYLMGIGTPDFILEAIENGIDLFDCVFPTRTARNGLIFTSRGPIAIKKAAYERDFGPPDPLCDCPVCATHSRAYLRHLYKCEEILYAMLATRHNLHFLGDLVRRARYSIEHGTFPSFKKDFLSAYGSGGE